MTVVRPSAIHDAREKGVPLVVPDTQETLRKLAADTLARDAAEKFMESEEFAKMEPDSSDVHVDAPLGSSPKPKKRRRKPPSNIRVVKDTLKRGRLPFGNASREGEFAQVLRRNFGRLGTPPDEVIAEAVRSRNPAIYEGWLDIDAWAERFGAELEDAYLVALSREGTRRWGDEPLVKARRKLSGLLTADFQLRNPRVSAWIADRSAKLVTSVRRDVKESIRAVISSMYTQGIHPNDAVPLIRAALGENALFPRWAQAVTNYALRLESEELPMRQIRQLVNAYYDRLADARAAMIARTEIIAAQNEGRIEAWTQMVESGMLRPDQVMKTWDASHEGVCPLCDELDGTSVELEELFDGEFDRPPAHPNCRCVVLLTRRR